MKPRYDSDGFEIIEGGDRRLTIDGVWDIETTGWDKFVCGSLWTRDTGTQVYFDEDELAEALLGQPRGTTLWAHAGGSFDVLWLLDWCHKKGSIPKATVTMSGSAIASMAITGGPVFRDSCRLIPMSLKKASTMFEGTKQKEELGLPCKCGRDCGGYCSIRVNLPTAQRNRLQEYLEADILALRDTMQSLLGYAEENGLHLAGTLAGSTWRTAKEWCGLIDADWDVRHYLDIRQGYFGGRVAGARTKAKRVWQYDRTQAYPAAMTRHLPVGEMLALEGKAANKAYRKGRPGFYQAIVDVPEMLAAPLPMRCRNRVVFPWGEVTGTWARAELQRAEEVGAKVKKVLQAWVWGREEEILSAYMRHCFKLREAAKTESLKLWVKLLANSLSGAFAQDPERDIIRFGDFIDDPAYEQVGRNYTWIWRRKVFGIPDRGHIHFAGTLTADARVELHRQICHAGDAWCYSDTDSVIATKELTRNVGHGLGLWKFEGKGRDFECLAPKVYSLVKDDDTRYARAKGISKAKEHWEAIRAREPVAFEGGVQSLLMAARGSGEGLFNKREQTRQMKPANEWLGGRLRDGERTREPHVDDLERLP
jgi:DNA polymerase type B, organellar and viral